MNIATIKKIVELYTVEQLQKAEEDLLEERSFSVEIEGKDEGEKLTHILAGIFCIEVMQKENIEINQAIRLYSRRVRESIN
jgi:hypothetical protein